MALGGKFYQTLTLWASGGLNLDGDKSFTAPCLLSGRHETKIETVLSPDGEEAKASEVFFTSEALAAGDWIAEGNQTAFATPLGLAAARQIISLKKIPALRGTETLYQAFA